MHLYNKDNKFILPNWLYGNFTASIVFFFIFSLTKFAADSSGDAFYLLDGGSDTFSCGHNVTTACGTFPWLLGVFYNDSTLNTGQLHPLNLISDISINIGPNITVSR